MAVGGRRNVIVDEYDVRYTRDWRLSSFSNIIFDRMKASSSVKIDRWGIVRHGEICLRCEKVGV